MKVELVKDFTFEAAHRLPQAPAGHKCRQLHGHSYRLRIAVEGDVDPEAGWFLDYGKIEEAVRPLLQQHLDHAYLNEVAGLENPTAENLCKWVWDYAKGGLPGLKWVSIHETPTTSCRFDGL